MRRRGGARSEGRLEWRGLVGRAGRRAPHAERAVILTAVQSLRLAGTEGAGWKRGWLGGGLVGRGSACTEGGPRALRAP